MRLYIDEDALAKALSAALRRLGFDVLTAQEAGMRGKSDSDHLAFASGERRVLFSYNRGDYFGLHTALLRRGDSHAGIAVLSARTYDVGAQLRGLIRIAEARGNAGMVDWIEFI